MITQIDPGSGLPHDWHLGQYEHEVRLAGGETADLKANYGLDGLTLRTDSLHMFMSLEPRNAPIARPRAVDGIEDFSDADSVELTWLGLTEFDCQTVGPIAPAEDGRVGIIGVRLLEEAPSRLAFELQMDWLQINLSCHSFLVRAQGHANH